ncbi:hypothetical protein BT96DRAFT_996230 [Gymnopus androsaceus JB14]|uniref:Ribonuclease H1 N-terminal domain-containing protein n=1 Tax=Gymnopus androsaceus JB14 TaxID=1447944 RepID=A0A6A4HJA5_9AGAR|nr:hypothetical protein BT96DRAFT_996230 [Gymnopus androsaceus JB14]
MQQQSLSNIQTALLLLTSAVNALNINPPPSTPSSASTQPSVSELADSTSTTRSASVPYADQPGPLAAAALPAQSTGISYAHSSSLSYANRVVAGTAAAAVPVPNATPTAAVLPVQGTSTNCTCNCHQNSATFYAVTRGRRVGIFTNWALVQTYVSGCSAAYKRFSSREEANVYFDEALQEDLKWNPSRGNTPVTYCHFDSTPSLNIFKFDVPHYRYLSISNLQSEVSPSKGEIRVCLTIPRTTGLIKLASDTYSPFELSLPPNIFKSHNPHYKYLFISTPKFEVDPLRGNTSASSLRAKIRVTYYHFASAPSPSLFKFDGPHYRYLYILNTQSEAIPLRGNIPDTYSHFDSSLSPSIFKFHRPHYRYLYISNPKIEVDLFSGDTPVTYYHFDSTPSPNVFKFDGPHYRYLFISKTQSEARTLGGEIIRSLFTSDHQLTLAFFCLFLVLPSNAVFLTSSNVYVRMPFAKKYNTDKERKAVRSAVNAANYANNKAKIQTKRKGNYQQAKLEHQKANAANRKLLSKRRKAKLKETLWKKSSSSPCKDPKPSLLIQPNVSLLIVILLVLPSRRSNHPSKSRGPDERETEDAQAERDFKSLCASFSNEKCDSARTWSLPYNPDKRLSVGGFQLAFENVRKIFRSYKDIVRSGWPNGFFQTLHSRYQLEGIDALTEFDTELQLLTQRMTMRVSILELEAYTEAELIRVETGKEMLSEMS